jgi:hypothetical protein
MLIHYIAIFDLSIENQTNEFQDKTQEQVPEDNVFA